MEPSSHPLPATEVVITTDGACKGNPGPGGWCAVLRYGAHQKVLRGGCAHTTNNQMEMTAAIEALRALRRPSRVRIRTDSRYLENGITRWIAHWKRNGWKTWHRKPVKNQKLWRELDHLIGQHEVQWEWVRGHAGDPDNELANRIAQEEAEKQARRRGRRRA
ncbi:MAG: ribonuclease HI [Anaerolineae bacterium]|nr:ribonuclease HI [Anaerolineae bacterium]